PCSLDGLGDLGIEAARVGLWGEGLVTVFAAASGGAAAVGAAVGAVFDDGFGPLAERAGNGMNDHGNLARQDACQDQRSRGDNPLIETVNSLLSGVFDLKHLGERVEASLTARLSFVAAAYNLLVQGEGMAPDARGLTPLSIARFVL